MKPVAVLHARRVAVPIPSRGVTPETRRGRFLGGSGSVGSAASTLATIAFVLLASGCGAVSQRTRGVLTSLTPYEVEVVQGNVVTAEQVAMLRPGLSREQVRERLGTPLLTDLFHAGRWDYVFTVHRQGIADQRRRLAVFFRDDRLDRFEGDEMPGETDFVARLDPRARAPAPGRDAGP